MTTHGGCRACISGECTFGVLQPIYLPPHAVSIPRTEVPMEAIIGVQVKSKSTPLQRDYSCRKYSLFTLPQLVIKKLNNSGHKRNRRAAELRSIGIGDATDSETSVRQLDLTPNNSEASFRLTPNLTSSDEKQSKISKESIDSGCQHEATRSEDCDNILDTYNGRNALTVDKGHRLNITVSKSSSGTLSDVSCSNRTLESDAVEQKKRSKKYHSAKKRSRKELNVSRSRSFQEQDVIRSSRNYSRLFTRRPQNSIDSSLPSEENVSHHNIEITVEDVDAVRLDAREPQAGAAKCKFDSTSLDSYDLKSGRAKTRGGRILGRIFRRMRKLSLGWPKSRCKNRRRGDFRQIDLIVRQRPNSLIATPELTF